MSMDIWSKQQGFSLLEGMISILLVAISGLGVAYTLSASMKAQVGDHVQNIVLAELRGQLASIGIQSDCSSAGQDSQGDIMIMNHDLQSTSNVSFSKHCYYQQIAVTVGDISQTVSFPKLNITVSDNRLGHYDMVINN
ncbi:PulJ/GspJ family protein [Shewanella sp.]|uniref:PulJ/GspJ family protein n=1 Tax=Shewanella sp. TaxID=50422 RepID=UPI003A9798E7